jgi:hypothetical protein
MMRMGVAVGDEQVAGGGNSVGAAQSTGAPLRSTS